MLGLIIDTVKTDRHFASNHEMFGTLIKGTGLEIIEKTLPQQQNSKGMIASVLLSAVLAMSVLAKADFTRV